MNTWMNPLKHIWLRSRKQFQDERLVRGPINGMCPTIEPEVFTVFYINKC